MPNKFKIGDKVTIVKSDKRTPAFVLEEIRLHRPRTIVAIFYDTGTQHTRYYLGANKRGKSDVVDLHFRASQLKRWVKGGIGHPRTKRHYMRHPR